MISKKWFWSIITIYIILGFYIYNESYQSLIAGLEVENIDNQWVITGFTFPELADLHDIKQGDILLEINNEDIRETSKLRYDKTIGFAESATLITTEGEVRQIKFSHNDLPARFFANYFLPLCYFLIALFLAIYLYIHKKGNKQALNFLILFILTVAIACGSIPLSIRMNWFGLIINSISTVLSPILLLSFLKYYYDFLSIRWRFFHFIKWFYVIPCIVFILTILEKFIPKMYAIDTFIILFLLLLLTIINLIIIVIGYVKYPKSQIKVIFWGIALPFMPFLILYVVPMLFFQNYIFFSSLLSIFFLFISFGFTFAQLSERLFDVDYYISRINYYSLFSLILTIVLSIGIYYIVSPTISKLIPLAVFIFVFIVISLYIKEYLDYTNRKVLFSPRGNYIHQLYSSIESIGKTVKVDELFEKLSSILSKQLELDIVYVVGYKIMEKQFVSINKDQSKLLHQSLSTSTLESLQLMEIKKTEHCYVACIHQDVEMKQFLILADQNHSSLKHEELLSLELLILFVNNFIDNTKLVEELFSKLNTMEQKDKGNPHWFEKLVLLKLEEEKKDLAQDLHDTVLQEQIFLIREMDTVLHKKNGDGLQLKIADFHKQLVSINHKLRAYCEILKPPLLDTLGLNAALNKLFMQTRKRADFSLIFSIEQIATTDKYMPLFIYRLIQEMLNNALKHSQATYVKIQLSNYENGFEIKYMDNGIGFDKELLKHSKSMGLTGMKERVCTYDGYFELDTYPDEGVQIQIRVGDV